MKFGNVPLSKAEGAILAHSVAVSSRVIRKGRVLTADDIAVLKAHGVDDVVVARLGADDTHEDQAAEEIAVALASEPKKQRVHITRAATGRVNLYASEAGVLRLDVAAVQAMNRINPMITLATLRPYQRVTKGEMIATVKIISYAVPSVDVDGAAKLVQDALSIATPVYQVATLIETRVRPEPPSIKGREALHQRLRRLGLRLDDRVSVVHETMALADTIGRARGEVLFILTGSATSDIRDTAPEAVRQAGGEVLHYGMPVDPGNLLFLGRIGKKPVVGLPGCARSLALNGADWVLERVICGIPIGAEDIADMGVGGLLKEIATRPQPREA